MMIFLMLSKVRWTKPYIPKNGNERSEYRRKRRARLRIPPPQAALFEDRFTKKHVALRLALRSVDAGRGSGRG